MNEYKNTIKAISDFIFVEKYPDKRVDLAFVPGSGYIESVEPLIEIYKKGLVRWIFISGYRHLSEKNEIPHSILLKNYLVKKGIPEQIIFTEEKSTNTKENILFSKVIIERKIGWKNISSIVFICRSYHSRRVLMTAEKYFPSDVEFYIIPWTYKGITKENWYLTKKGIKKVAEEIEKIGKYILKSDIGKFGY